MNRTSSLPVQGAATGAREAGAAPARPDDETLAALCKALAHPARLAILRHLAALNRCVCGEIVDIMPLAQSTVSQHLKVLKEAGLVRGEVDGPRMCYCVDQDVLRCLKVLIGEL